MVAVILVNWNGYEDTIACISSLQKCVDKNFFVVVCDNGSTNDSVSQITSYCQKHNLQFDTFEKTNNCRPDVTLTNGHVLLYQLGDNYGFSKGNNIGIQFASFFHPKYYLLLNNDTEVEPDFLCRLVEFQRTHTEYKVLTPLIHYYYDKHLIWNGGGNIYWGFRKYHFADQNESVVPKQESIPCTFITGCALFFVPELLDEKQRLLTEKFFFGEEDFEFGLRMKKLKVKMACVLDSVIYHKVGGSRKSNANKIGYTYIYYLNRIINVRDYLPRWQFPFYELALYASVARVLKTYYNFKWKGIVRFIKKMKVDSNRMSGVSKDFFLVTISDNNKLFLKVS